MTHAGGREPSANGASRLPKAVFQAALAITPSPAASPIARSSSVAITCLGSAGVTEVDHGAPLMPPALSSLEMLDRVIRSPPIDTGQCGHKTPTKPKSDPLCTFGCVAPNRSRSHWRGSDREVRSFHPKCSARRRKPSEVLRKRIQGGLGKEDGAAFRRALHYYLHHVDSGAAVVWPGARPYQLHCWRGGRHPRGVGSLLRAPPHHLQHRHRRRAVPDPQVAK